MSIQTPRRVSRRIPPRRRRPPRTVFRGLILPLFKLAVVLTVGFLLVSTALGKIARPFKLYSREDREAQRVASELDAIRKENAELQRRINYLNTPQGIAEAARKLGWVKPGEITLVLPDQPPTERSKPE